MFSVKKEMNGTMQNWKDLKIEGISKIERIAAIFQVWVLGTFPFGHITFKIVEMPNGKYFGVPDVAAKDKTGSSEWISGQGETISEALEEAVQNFLRSISENDAVSVENFEWVDPNAF